MEARIQFRVDEKAKKLAQMSAERKGTTLSDECRKLTEELAKEQRNHDAHDAWLLKEVSKAYDLYCSGRSEFVSHDDAMKALDAKKNEVKAKLSKAS